MIGPGEIGHGYNRIGALLGVAMSTISEDAIRQFLSRIVDQFQPEKVILFGSYARGNPTPDSDVDVLVVLPFEGRNPEKATQIWIETRPAFPVDIIVRKPHEYKERLKLGDLFFQEIEAKGKVFYEATYA